MSHDSSDQRAQTPEADPSAPGAMSSRSSGSARSSRSPGSPGSSGSESSSGSSTAPSAPGPARGRSSLPVHVDEEELLIGDTDVTAALSALAELGAEGSAALDGLSASETIALLNRLQALSGATAAVQARALVRLEDAVAEDCLQREETPARARRIARAEASRALKQSTSCAGQSMSSGRRLVRSMPGMLAALARGEVVAASAHRVGRTMGPASPAQRRHVDQILTTHLPYLADCGPEEWGGEAEKVLHGLDPHGAAARHQNAKRERGVTVRRAEHGMSTVTARLTGLDGARIRKGLSLAAEKARAQGDRRGHQQIMADLFADALIGRGDGVDPSTLEIGVIITDRSLLAPEHADAATIEGFGPVPYMHIREEMREAVEAAGEDPEVKLALRQLYADLEDGQLVAVESRARVFPPALARFLRFGHQTCRAPYCDASIRQNDHIVPSSQGGATSLENGNGLCAADNQKEEAGETVRVLTDEDGTRRTVEWTTRYGQKARRRGINFDPVGTAYRQRWREHEQERERAATQEAHELREREERRARLRAQQRERERVLEHRRDLARLRREEEASDGANTSLHRAFARILPSDVDHLDLHPAARLSRQEARCLRRRRVDLIQIGPEALLTDDGSDAAA